MGSGGSSSTQSTNLALQQQQRDLATQLRQTQQQANQYEFANLGLLTQQMGVQAGTEAAIAAQMQNLYSAGQNTRTQYENILAELGGLQSQQFTINEWRTGLERNYANQEMAAASSLQTMVQNRTRLLEQQESNAMRYFDTVVPRAQNRLDVAQGNYRLGSLQPFTPKRIGV